MDALEKTVLALQAAVALKKDAKTVDQQAADWMAKVQQANKLQYDLAMKEQQKIMKAAMADVEKMKVDARLNVLEAQVKALLVRH